MSLLIINCTVQFFYGTEYTMQRQRLGQFRDFVVKKILASSHAAKSSINSYVYSQKQDSPLQTLHLHLPWPTLSYQPVKRWSDLLTVQQLTLIHHIIFIYPTNQCLRSAKKMMANRSLWSLSIGFISHLIQLCEVGCQAQDHTCLLYK